MSVTVLALAGFHVPGQAEEMVSAKNLTLQGRIEIIDLSDTSARDTQSQYWSARGTKNYIAGKINQAEKDFQKAVDEADNSKLSNNQKALMISNLAAAKREKHEFSQSEELFKKSLSLVQGTSIADEKLESYISRQYSVLLRLQGKNAASDSVLNRMAFPVSAGENGGKFTGILGLEELKTDFGGLQVPAKLHALNGDQLIGKVMVDRNINTKPDFVTWHRVPHGLAGTWHCSDACTTTRQENLLNGKVSMNSLSLSKLFHTSDEIPGKQIDAKGDIWDLDEYPTTEQVTDPEPGTKAYFRTTYSQTISVDEESICSLFQFENIITSAQDNKILSHKRYSQLNKMQLVDNNSAKMFVVDVDYDDRGRAIARHDYNCSAFRSEKFAKNDKYKSSFCAFLTSQKLSSLIPQ
ncbi:MAG: hypothetical protein K2X81_02650 [Candidatus Obscuribacterales bacterium]|nr:hypothetical protein [Candidatus Obscuribacterales bacterium]